MPKKSKEKFMEDPDDATHEVDTLFSVLRKDCLI